ncbi:MAG: THUMP-like domain-containing protein [Pirellulaceae bacterium]
MSEQLDDYRWLISEDAVPWLAGLAECPNPTVAQVHRLRQALTPERTHLVLEQCDLRRRALQKFDSAAGMFFTRSGLEQATDQWIAREKARRFPADEVVADLCCGLGGDLFGLAAQTSVIGIDLNPLHTLLAAANARTLGLDTCLLETADAARWPLERHQAWHMDPDRRPLGQRTTQLAVSEPSIDVIRLLLTHHPDAALKLAPAADLPEDWQAAAERQWIGSGRECRQQVVWFGRLAHSPGCRSALVVDCHGRASPVLVGRATTPCPVATPVARFVYEPHACVVAAGLTRSLAEQFGLAAIDPQVAYLTGDRSIHDLRLSAFEVQDVLPFDMRCLRKLVRARRIGKLEVKKRGVAIDPASVQRQLHTRGDEHAVLILTPQAGCVRAIVAQRVGAREV